jgi:hypothetical protein
MAEVRANRHRTSSEVRSPTPPHTHNSQENNARAKKKGHEHHVFCGTTFHVSERQFDMLEGELGDKRNGFDLFAAFQRWDQLGEPIYNLLPYLKAKIASELGLKAPLTATQQASIRAVPSVDQTQAYLKRLREEA